MNAVRLGVVVIVVLTASEMPAAPAPSFRPDRHADRAALVLLKRDLAAQEKELVEFGAEEEFWVATVVDHQERPSRRWQYVVAQRQAPTRVAAFEFVRRRFIADAPTSDVEPD